MVVDRVVVKRRYRHRAWPTFSRPRWAWPTDWPSPRRPTAASAPCSRRNSPARSPASPSTRSSRGCSRSTIPMAPARPATASASPCISIRELVVPDERKSLRDGAIAPWAGSSSQYYHQTLESLAKHYKFRLDQPFGDLPEKARHAILWGSGKDEVSMRYEDGTRAYTTKKPFEGVIPNLDRRYEETDFAWMREDYRPVTSRAALRGLPRRPPQARGPGGQDQQARHLPGLGLFDLRGAGLVRSAFDARSQPQAARDRKPHPARRSTSGWASSTMSGSII